ncbi:TniQ family protein [Pseudomonas oryzae]|uniref:TniQ protein n=1 Tax=Pseudomonas oryzae TaxID=1392877 RepID=A0A1H1QCN1_9PSED|nr:TniQ family protein [Pseudomonas oryzae]SDS21206.1 TniQ protein [Pseudomonas oryzae]
MIKFRGLPRPVYDETFTSWISRCGNAKHSRLPSLLDVRVSESISGGRFSHEDPDFDFESAYVLSAVRLIGVDLARIKCGFSPNTKWVLPWHQRKHYCPDCLIEDIRDGRNPSWRKSWCYAFSSHCQFHKRQLVEFSGKLSVDKAWDAFVEYVNFNNTSSETSSKWASVAPTKLRYLLHLKSLRLAGVGPSSCCKKDNILSTFDCFKILTQIFLQARTTRTPPGAARHLFFSGRLTINRSIFGYPDVLEIGALETNAHERMCGVILSGFILSFYSKKDLELAGGIYSYTGYHFPEDKYRLGFLAFDLASQQDYLYVKSLFDKIPSSILNDIKRFIEGIDAANLRRFC